MNKACNAENNQTILPDILQIVPGINNSCRTLETKNRLKNKQAPHP